MEGLKVSDANLVVYVHPSNANNVHKAVLRQLSASLFKFDEILDGVLLAYSFESLSNNAKILSGLIPYFGVNIKAKLLLFSPKPHMLIEGKVAKLGRESIHVVVLGMCSAAITSEDIREEFVYKTKGGVGKFASTTHKKHVIKQGSMIRFVVKSLDEEILHVTGSLTPANTGSIRWLSRQSTEDSGIERSVKRERSREKAVISKEEPDHGVISEAARSTPQKIRRIT